MAPDRLESERNGGSASAVVLPRAMFDEIVDHARQETPRECCGVIAGRSGRADRLFRLTNVAPGNTLYDVDPSQVFDLEFRLLPDAGLDVVAIYHSHPATEAYPSPTDQAQAFWPEAVYLICSLLSPEAPVVRGFRLGGTSIVEVLVEVIE